MRLSQRLSDNHNFAVAVINFKRGTYLSIVKNILTRYCTVDWQIENANVRNFNESITIGILENFKAVNGHKF